MSAPPLGAGYVARLIGGLSDPAARVTGADWHCQPVLPLSVWLALCLAGVLLAVLTYGSRKARAAGRWRIVLTLLRSLAMVVTAGLLLQPGVTLHLERKTFPSVALVLDRSGSMAVRDRAAEPARSRWEQVVGALQASRPSSAVAGAMVFCFDERVWPVAWRDLEGQAPPDRDRPTAIGPALEQITSALADRPDTQVVLFSDGATRGAEDEEKPRAAARALKRTGLRLHTVLAGDEQMPFVAVRPAAPRFCAVAGEPADIEVRLAQQGLSGATVGLALTESETVLASRRVTFPWSGPAETTEWLRVVFDRPGVRRCGFGLEPASRPAALVGAPALEVIVVAEPIRVLCIERRPRWQFQFLRGALGRDRRFQARFVQLGAGESNEEAALPARAGDFSEIDVVLLGDVGPQDLTEAAWRSLCAHVVQDGGGLILAAGPEHLPAAFLDSPLADLLPFRRAASAFEDLDSAWRLVPTQAGRRHPLMQLHPPGEAGDAWGRLAGLYWCARVSDLKPGAQVLAERRGEPPWPVVILQRAGRGVVLFVGTDETWRWRGEGEPGYFDRFWAQGALFAGLPHREPASPPGPATAAVARRPAGRGEEADVRPRAALLEQLAAEGGGECVPLRDWPALQGRLEQAGLCERWCEQVPCWDRWTTLAALVTLIGAEWVLRKRLGLP